MEENSQRRTHAGKSMSNKGEVTEKRSRCRNLGGNVLKQFHREELTLSDKKEKAYMMDDGEES